MSRRNAARDAGQGTGTSFGPFLPGRRLPAAPMPIRCRAGLPLLAALGAGGYRPSHHGRDLTAPRARARAAVEGVQAPAKTCDIRHHPHLPPSCRLALHRYRAGNSRPDTTCLAHGECRQGTHWPKKPKADWPWMVGHCGHSICVVHSTGGNCAPRDIRACLAAGHRRDAVDPDRAGQVVPPAALCCGRYPGDLRLWRASGPGNYVYEPAGIIDGWGAVGDGHAWCTSRWPVSSSTSMRMAGSPRPSARRPSGRFTWPGAGSMVCARPGRFLADQASPALARRAAVVPAPDRKEGGNL
jgi:hypothetical protein